MTFKKINSFKIKNNQPGFTIVELLIVVVVNAILAAITIVAYNGITSQAKESVLKSDLTTAAKKLQIAKVENGEFPADARGGGTARTYEIAKLADNKCWMLNNLKLGSETGSTTLTPVDSNVASNFTLPQLYSGSDSAQRDYDTPKTYGPVPGDAGGHRNAGLGVRCLLN